MSMNTPPHKEKILLVDDEEDIRDVLCISLEDIGYCVLPTENAEKAMQTFREETPPIVLTDIKMPGMDGIELLRKIKHENPETEVIMITGHGDMSLAIKSLKYEATDFITKPINVDALEIALSRACEKIKIRAMLKEYTENLERLIKEKTELQDHLSSLGLMIGSISHGIKGLLTGLDGGRYLLDAGLKKGDLAQVEEGWDIVKQMIGRIRKMVQDILFYAKERALKFENVDVLVFAREIAQTADPKISGQGIELVCNFDANLGKFEIDTGYVHSALINILENAADACTRDETKSSHTITFSVTKKNKYINFKVADNGTGMDDATQQKLFTLFFSSKGRRGTGLGLFIANKIIGQHGGHIEVESTPGQGATFSVLIPISPPST
jgi:signal transduction histidine kinase